MKERIMFCLLFTITPIIFILLVILINNENNESTTVEEYNNVAEKYNDLLDNFERSQTEYTSLMEDYSQLQSDYNDLTQAYNLQEDELQAYKEISVRNADSSFMDISIPTIPDDCVGYMYIPTCDVSAYIRYGSTMEAISNYHIGEFEDSGEIGVGNYSVCGHASTQKQLIFSKLESISIGDPIYIYKDGTLYKFSADYKRKINPEDTWILDDTGTGEATCTLMCCTDSGERRFVVFGNLIRSQEIEESEN